MKSALDYREHPGRTGYGAYLTRSKMEELEALDEELEEFEWEGEINRRSREYTRWIQESLNKILGLRLATDGIMGTQTRSAIRSFQRLKSLAVDGVVGTQTERALITAGAGNPPGVVSPPSAPPQPLPGAAPSASWVLPPDVRAAGERQFVRYDSPPAWDNGKNCTGSFTSGAAELRDYIRAAFRGVSAIGGYNCRQNTANSAETSVHGTGRALDIMIPLVNRRANSAVGDPIANWLVQNADAIGIQFIIWNHTRWSGFRSGRKDGAYGGPNPHIDHIHAELNRDGAARSTPWFSSRIKSTVSAPTPSMPAPSSSAFRLLPVETPGGGRIQDKRAPAAADLVTVPGAGGRQIKLHRLAADAWRAMVSAARIAGISDPLLLPTSGYRSPEYQQQLWDKALARYGSPEEARKWVAPPGGSAHQSGRAIDLYLGGKNDSRNVNSLQAQAAYKWLAANARQFGFYPYGAEPWHWEYNPPAQSVAPNPATDVSKMSKSEFIEFVGNTARQAKPETGVPASVTVAQAILETGWGAHTISDAKNLFGIKGKGPAGSVRAQTKEVVNGKRITIYADFAKYNSFEESITEHNRFFIRNRRYATALKYKADPDRFAREIHKAGYATDPKYADALISLMQRYNLYRFDQ